MRCFASIAAVVLAGMQVHAGRPADPGPAGEIHRALARAGAWLAGEQSEDGSWRSSHYVYMEDGLSLTPLAVTVTDALSRYGLVSPDVAERGAVFLADAVMAMDSAETLSYPVYEAASASWAVTLGSNGVSRTAARTRWLDILRLYQLSTDHGWRNDEPQAGGWGYSPRPPHKKADESVTPYTANLSATLFAVAALRGAGWEASSEVLQQARRFVLRCQNLGAGTPDDGGFCFSPGDAAASKAGEAQEGLRSYGSATADGVRALLALGVPPEDPAVRAGAAWLCEHFDPRHVAGTFAPGREDLRDAYYFYYAWTLAHALHTLGIRECGGRLWAEDLARVLLEKQADDGSWRNHGSDAREDDPLVATPLATAALAVCYRNLLLPAEAPRIPFHGR